MEREVRKAGNSLVGDHVVENVENQQRLNLSVRSLSKLQSRFDEAAPLFQLGTFPATGNLGPMSFTGVRGRGASLPVTECLLRFRVKFRCRVQVHLPPVKLARGRAESDSLCVQALTVFRRCKDYLSPVLNDLFQLSLSLSLSLALCTCPKLPSLFEAPKRHSEVTQIHRLARKGFSWLARFTVDRM